MAPKTKAKAKAGAKRKAPADADEQAPASAAGAAAGADDAAAAEAKPSRPKRGKKSDDKPAAAAASAAAADGAADADADADGDADADAPEADAKKATKEKKEKKEKKAKPEDVALDAALAAADVQALSSELVVSHQIELRYYGNTQKEKKKCGGCRKAIGPGTLRVYMPNAGCRHIAKCWHSGLERGRYITASSLTGWDDLTPADTERLHKRIKELFRETSHARYADGRALYKWSDDDFLNRDKWKTHAVRVVPVYRDG